MQRSCTCLLFYYLPESPVIDVHIVQYSKTNDMLQRKFDQICVKYPTAPLKIARHYEYD